MLRWLTLAGTAAAITVTACAVNPATGRREFMLISTNQEIAMGQQYDPEVVASFGLYGGEEWQTYLNDLGTRMAARTERPELPWTFRVIDDPIVNAFAVPGGYVYITRGILAHFNSEAQLAAVVGHEIAHVTARHSAAQMSSQTLLGGLLGVGSILVPELETAFAIAGAGVQILSLKHSRDDESEADSLGLGYMYRVGYDPRPMPGVYDMLNRVSQLYGAGRTPEWLSTHPNPENREQRMRSIIAALPDQNFDNRTVNAASYLQRLDGMVFGENPRNGFFENNVFRHPDLAFEFDFPAGWQMQNQTQAVVGINGDQNAMIQVSLTEAASPSVAAQTFFSQDGVTGSTAVYRSQGLTGVRGDFTATTDNGTLNGHAAWVTHGGRVYQLIGYGTAAAWGGNRPAVQTALLSFRPLTDPAALSVQPNRLDIVRLDRSMTITAFHTRYPSVVDPQVIELINQVGPTEILPSGTLVKRVISP